MDYILFSGDNIPIMRYDMYFEIALVVKPFDNFCFHDKITCSEILGT